MAIAEALMPQVGGDRKSDQKQNFAFDRDSAARKAGFGNYETARQAKTVVTSGAPELIDAMDSGRVAISGAGEEG